VLAPLRAPGALKRVLDRRRVAHATASGLRAREGHRCALRASSPRSSVDGEARARVRLLFKRASHEAERCYALYADVDACTQEPAKDDS
jgi:hypothetical protein